MNENNAMEARRCEQVMTECRDVLKTRFLDFSEYETCVTLSFLIDLIGRKARAELNLLSSEGQK
jgi:hypothetical protein